LFGSKPTIKDAKDKDVAVELYALKGRDNVAAMSGGVVTDTMIHLTR
jgi:hypothetical protein